ncbi:MAG: SPOR domain-containing protein [Lysobacteraceae bacterium]
MDSAFKQRLIGAAVLVAVAVIVLPMLIGGPDDAQIPAQSTVPLDIPQAPDRRFETRELSPAPQPVPNAVVPAAPVMPEAPVATMGTTASQAPAQDGGFDLSSRPSQATPAPSTSAVSEPPKPAPQPESPKPAEPPKPALAVAAPPTTLTGGYAVNLGSYVNLANADALVAQLKQKNLPAYAEPVQLDGKPAKRVRLGPYAQRGQAESARLSAQLVRKDVPAAVVALDGEASAPAAAKPAVAAGFAVQIGALKTEEDANQLRNRARAAGFPAYVERAVTGAGVLWRVRVGPELQRANAEKARDEIRAKLNIADANVVAHP